MKKVYLILVSAFFMFALLCLQVIAKDIEWQQSPKTVGIDKNAVGVFVPESFVFADEENTKAFLQKNMVKRSGNEIGLIMSADPSQEWFILLQYQKVGYFEEKLFVNMDSDQFINAMEKKTKSDRIINPIGPKLEVVGYKEKPFYNNTKNTLSSAIRVKQGKHNLVNYIVMIYGRQAVLVTRLVCEEDLFPELKIEMDKIVENIAFQPGHRYADFDPENDKYALSSGSDILKYMLTGEIPPIEEAVSKKDKEKKDSINNKPANEGTQGKTASGIPGWMILLGGLIGIGAVIYIFKSMFA